jgi:hypothetical protein
VNTFFVTGNDLAENFGQDRDGSAYKTLDGKPEKGTTSET